MKSLMRSFFTVIFLIATTVFCEETNLEEALLTVKKNNPELKIYEAEISKAQSEKVRADILLPSNPELEVNQRTGTRYFGNSLGLDLATGAAGYDKGGAVHDKTTEVGITQEIEIAGQRGLRRKLADLRIVQAKTLYYRKTIQLLTLFRIHYYMHSASGEMEDHLEDHIKRLKIILGRLGMNYKDPRLGSYVITAIISDITGLEAEKNKSTITKLSSQIEMKRLTGNPSQEIKIPGFKSLRLPELPDENIIIARAKEKKPDLILAKNAYEFAELDRDLATRLIYPNPRLFLYSGREEYTPAGIPFSGSEKESYMRIGLRFPLPIFDRSQANIKRAEADMQFQKALLNYIHLNLENDIKLAYQKYKKYYDLAIKLEKSHANSHIYMDQMADAFARGRITYFEFKSEHEKWHGLHKEHHDTVMNALEAYGELELAAGFRLEDAP